MVVVEEPQEGQPLDICAQLTSSITNEKKYVIIENMVFADSYY